MGAVLQLRGPVSSCHPGEGGEEAIGQELGYTSAKRACFQGRFNYMNIVIVGFKLPPVPVSRGMSPSGPVLC